MRYVKTVLLGVVIGSMTLSLSGCSGTGLFTKTNRQQASYAIYDVKASERDYADISNAIVTAMQANTSKVSINQGVAPYPLPKQAGHFKLVDMGGSSLGAMAALGGNTLPQIPTCPGAVLTVNGTDTQFADYGQRSQIWTCLFAYQGGYRLDVYANYSQDSGLSSIGALGEMLAEPLVGTSQKFIPKTIREIVAGIKQAGGKVVFVDGFPKHKQDKSRS